MHFFTDADLYTKIESKCGVKFLVHGGPAVWWLVHWTSDLKVGGSKPSPWPCVVSLDTKLYLTLSRWHTAGGNRAMK